MFRNAFLFDKLSTQIFNYMHKSTKVTKEMIKCWESLGFFWTSSNVSWLFLSIIFIIMSLGGIASFYIISHVWFQLSNISQIYILVT